ncbi:GAF domain-containing protein [Pseudarthrobacter sp. TAF60_1]|uniref:sensor histidine kinase n=1 Tax=Pseudarthrobacter sp. TAF60_1 TaxID=3233071 RepID=UPI003F9D88FF
MSESSRQTTNGPEHVATSRMDELLSDFVDRAGEMESAQQRMQGLLNAVVALAEDLSLEAVLLRVVSSACHLLEAEYGALGVIGSDRGLSHFITVGIDDELAHKIGPLPTGHGVLGLLIRDPKPLRLHDLSQHPDAYGFPEHHPQMKSFLGVPVRVRDSVFGNLYLTQKKGGGDFTDEDEGLAEALAAAAGVAIENARLYDEARRRTAWLQACMDVSGKVMGDEAAPVGQVEGLDMIAARALQESGASLALILVPEEDSNLFRVAGAAGRTAPEWAGGLCPFDSKEVGAVLASGQAAVIDDAAALSGGPVPNEGRLLVVDLSARGTHHGLLVLVREGAAGAFSKTDVEMGAVFGSHVALALELARAHRMREQLAVFTDRDRIARDLHDLVIQRLFAAGLSIQSLRRLITGESAARTLQTVTAELDEVIRELRNTIYSLNGSPMERELLSSRVLKAVRGAARSLRFVPRLTLTGPIDAIGDEETASNILAVVTEGLSNAVRHSGADSIRVSVSVDDGFVYVRVQDNGAGFSVRTPGNGMTNMQHRASKLGGTFEVTSSPDTGTALTWKAPVF